MQLNDYANLDMWLYIKKLSNLFSLLCRLIVNTLRTDFIQLVMDIRNYKFGGEMVQITSCINSNIRFYFLNTFLSLLNKTYKLKVVMDLQKQEGELNTVCVKSGVDLNLPFRLHHNTL